ncbi:MAG: hypothetical protein RMX59_002490 [Nostoc sp. DedSLP05]|nr:hypothetical protein [Nostoc sp. DedSLP05]
MTSSSKNRFQVYADMGVPEIWRYDGSTFTINVLQNQEYISVAQSLAFPNLSLTEISHFLEQVEEKDYLELVKQFRQWIRLNS